MASTFVSYSRVSTARQGASGLGLEAQRADVVRYLSSVGGELIDEYTDIESGTRKGNNRPQLALALAACKRNRATLVIAKLDRLSRNVAFLSTVLESGVEVVCVDNPQANRLVMHILAAVAEEEARAVSVRTKAALAAARARGVKLGTPENLSAEARQRGGATRQKQAVDAYAKLSPLVASLRHKGFSLEQIAQHLNNLGEVTASGAEFQRTTVRRILTRLGVAA